VSTIAPGWLSISAYLANPCTDRLRKTLCRSPALYHYPVRPARFTSTLASEWAKVRTARSTWVCIALAITLCWAMTGLIALAVGSTYDDWGAAEQASFEPIMFSLAGIIFGFITLAVLGVLIVSGEYASGMIRTTFTATPRRGRVLAAKAILVVVLTTLTGTIAIFGMFFIGQAVMGSFNMPTTTLSNPDASRTLIGLSLSAWVFPLFGMVLGFLLRSTAGAITAIMAILWLPEFFGPLLPLWWRENVLSLLPGASVDALTIAHINSSPTYHDVPIAAVVITTWLVVALGGTFFALTRRDA